MSMVCRSSRTQGADMSDPKYCYKCQTILTFCECDESITTEGDWQRWAQEELESQAKEIKRLTTSLWCAKASVSQIHNDYTVALTRIAELEVALRKVAALDYTRAATTG